MTQEQLKLFLHYDKDTGIFTNLTTRSSTALKGNNIISKTTNGYHRVHINRKEYYIHRLAWLYVYGKIPKTIDHINGDKLDNRISNLRDCSQKENQKNRRLSKNNATGVNGVHIRNGKFISSIKIDRKKIYLGTFKTLEEAKISREEANIKYGFNKNHGLAL